MVRKIFVIILSLIILCNCIFISRVYADNSKKSDKDYVICEVLLEAETGTILKSVNGDKKVSVGTMAKLMTVLLTAEAIENGKMSLDDIKKTSSYANSMQGAQIWLMAGEEMKISDLLKGVIIGNANDASVSLAEAVCGTEEKFVSMMNKRAKELGMLNTSFTNCNGYYDDAKQVSSAIDMAILASELSKYDKLTEYFTCWLDYLRDGATELVNANTLVRTYEGITGFKAGYTDSSGYYAVCGAKRNDNEYIAVVIGCDDKDLSFNEAKRLLNSGFSEFQKVKPDKPKDVPVKISVKGGLEKEIPLVSDEIQNIVIPNGTFKSVTSRVVMPDYIYAPVTVGQNIGEIQYFRNDKLLFSINITAADGTEKMNIKKALGIILKFISTF